MKSIKQYIGPQDVLTSSELISRLKADGKTDSQARQMILRKSKPGADIWRSNDLQLPGRVRLFAHATFLGRPKFLQKVSSILDEHRPGLARLLRTVERQHVVLRSEAEGLLACPIGNRLIRKHPTFSAEVLAAQEIGAVNREDESGPFDRLVLPALTGTDQSKTQAATLRVRALESLTYTRILVDHMRRQNVISWTGHQLPQQNHMRVDFNDYSFSAFAYSYLHPLKRSGAGADYPVPAPVLFDVHSKSVTTDHVDAFLARIQRAGRSRAAISRMLGVMAAVHFEPTAWQKAKQLGLIVINLVQLAGRDAINALSQMAELIETNRDAAKDGNKGSDGLEASVDNISSLLDRLGTNPFVVELRSYALEALAALTLFVHGYENVATGFTVPFGDSTREVDASGDKLGRTEAYIVECKAYPKCKELPREDVIKFFTETLPAARKSIALDAKTCKAELWTTGIVGDGARQALAEIKLRETVVPKLRDAKQIAGMLPRTLKSCDKLLRAIAVAE